MTAAAGPRTLIIDIETRPPLTFTWGLRKQFIGLEQIVDLGGVMAFAAKWHGERSVEFRSDYHDGHDDMIRRAYELVGEADVVVHYNGDRFDMRHLRREWAQHGFTPVAPFIPVDLMKSWNRRFVTSTGSFKLDALLMELGLPRKLEHEGFRLWRDCLLGDDKAKARAWRLMRRYNMQDTRSTEGLLDYVYAWIAEDLPHAGLYGDDVDPDVCHACRSTELRRRGWGYTKLSRFRRFRCHDCGAWNRSTRRDAGVTVRAAA